MPCTVSDMRIAAQAHHLELDIFRIASLTDVVIGIVRAGIGRAGIQASPLRRRLR